MAIKTLKGVDTIGGFAVVVMDELREKFPEKFNEKGGMDYQWFEKEIRPSNFIYVRNDVSSIAFTLQNGPVKKSGVNGCQVDTIIQAAKIILEGLDQQFPSHDNATAIKHLALALLALSKRTQDREKRGVEGTNKV